VGAVHHHLVKSFTRLKVGLLLDAADVREVHHMCALVGYGLDAVCPRLALQTIESLAGDDRLKVRADSRGRTPPLSSAGPAGYCWSDRGAHRGRVRARLPQAGYGATKLVTNFIKAVHKGMLKVFAKIGISTLHSYKGAQIFEAVGLGADVIETCFVGTASRVGGRSLEGLGADLLEMHEVGAGQPASQSAGRGSGSGSAERERERLRLLLL
jgi:glutamate synthase (NADPH/NADH)